MESEAPFVAKLSTVYNALFVCAAAYFVNLGFDDLRDHGRVSFIRWSGIASLFQTSHLVNVFSLWLLCIASVFLASGGFQLWRCGRTALLKWNRGCVTDLWNYGAMAVVVFLHATMIVFPIWAAYIVDLPASATCALAFEQVRLLMKSYSYLREHVKSALALRDTNDSLLHLAYFLFAPTLVYKDSYERAPRRRVGVILGHLAMFLLAIFTMVVVSFRSTLRSFCGGPDGAMLDASPLSGAPRLGLHIGAITVRAMPLALVLITGADAAGQSFQAMFAELLRYPTQEFMQAWWNAPSYAVFLHRWNQFVKAWLHTYVFKELLARRVTANVAKQITIVLSAIWHEYIIAVSLGYFLPWFTIVYVFGTSLVIPDRLKVQKGVVGNFFVFLTLSVGMGSFVAVYFLESTARLTCAPTVELPWDVFVPRALTCEQIFANCTTF